MLDDDALVARQPWDWSELVVEEFFPAVTAPNTVYIARCPVVCRPWIIHEVAILNTAGGLRVSLPDRVYLSRGQIALTDDGKPRRIAVISMLDADDWNGFSDAVIEAVQAGWGRWARAGASAASVQLAHVSKFQIPIATRPMQRSKWKRDCRHAICHSRAYLKE